MQDKTINNALLALHWRKDAQAELARQILTLRGVPLPRHVQDRPLARGRCKKLALSMLPCTSTEVADVIQELVPGISRKSAVQRAYMALRRLAEAGLVRREDRVWHAKMGYRKWRDIVRDRQLV